MRNTNETNAMIPRELSGEIIALTKKYTLASDYISCSFDATSVPDHDFFWYISEETQSLALFLALDLLYKALDPNDTETIHRFIRNCVEVWLCNLYADYLCTSKIKDSDFPNLEPIRFATALLGDDLHYSSDIFVVASDVVCLLTSIHDRYNDRLDESFIVFWFSMALSIASQFHPDSPVRRMVVTSAQEK